MKTRPDAVYALSLVTFSVMTWALILFVSAPSTIDMQYACRVNYFSIIAYVSAAVLILYTITRSLMVAKSALPKLIALRFLLNPRVFFVSLIALCAIITSQLQPIFCSPIL